jgi:hypothetical protein
LGDLTELLRSQRVERCSQPEEARDFAQAGIQGSLLHLRTRMCTPYPGMSSVG